MSNVAKLKKKAAEFELKKDFGKALAVYVEILDNFAESADEVDVSLFNRVGDLMVRQGNVADAVDYYERAVDHYVEGGFYNNAIALCNKILRHSPGRASVYYKLGKISAHKGFVTDAKQNFLEYADRMQKSGNMNEAFRALKEFADLCPGQDDIRQMLADQLSKLDRKAEAVEQLQLLWQRYESEGRTAEAAATVQRMKAIDPTVEPQAGGTQRQARPADLVFLDLDEAPLNRALTPAPPGARRPPAPRAPPPAAVADLPLLDSGYGEEEEEAEPAAPPPPRVAYKPKAPAAPAARAAPPPPPPVETLPPLVEEIQSDAAPMAGFETTSLGETTASPPDQAFSSGAPPQEPAAEPELLDFDSSAFDPTSSGSLGYEDTAAEPLFPEAQMLEPIAPEIFGRNPDAEPSLLDGPPHDPFGFEPISHDSSSLHIDLPPSDALSPETSHLWEPAEPPRGPRSSKELRDLDPPILRSDALEVTDLSENGAASSDDSLDIPLVDFDVPSDGSSLDMTSPFGSSFNGASAPELRRSTQYAERSVEILQGGVDAEPENWGLRRQLAEAMFESGDREGGIRELEAAMVGAERSGDLDLASAIAEEIARLDPETVRYHQKRVEYAFRTNDKLRLIEAYLALAGALLGTEQAEKARAVYQRVLDLAPNDIRAQAALESLALMEPPAPPPTPEPRRSAPRVASSSAPRGKPAPEQPSLSAAGAEGGAGFINLGDLLRDEAIPRSTRMVVEEQEPTGDEEADFADMLKKFKQGIAENVEEGDYQSHYDLGVAFKEMGLVDEAIAEFQKALRSPTNRMPTYEALGNCFLEKEQHAIAATVLARALNEKGYTDDQLVGVLYLLGRASEALNRHEDALTYYQRVFVVDIEFRDVADRISEVERIAR